MCISKKAGWVNDVCGLLRPPGVRKSATGSVSQHELSPTGSFREFVAQVVRQQRVEAETDPKSVA